jgi:hypothetical protein
MKDNIKREAIKCLESLTTHGLPNLTRTKYNLIKLMWLVLTITSAGLSVYFIIRTLSEYAEYNVTTEVRFIKSDEPLEFPTISICKKNRLSTNYSVKLIKNFDQSNYNYSFKNLFQPNFSDFKSKLSLHLLYSKYLFSGIEMNEREKYSLSMKDSLDICFFDNQTCNFTDFEWFFNSKYGNCYKFNANGLKKSYQANEDNGLLIGLRLKNPPEIENLGLEKGLLVSIDSKNIDTYSDFDNLIKISTGFETSIKIEKSLFRKYPKPYSNCDFLNGSIKSLKQEQIELYNEIIEANLSYSHSLCVVYCRQRYYTKYLPCKFKSSSLLVANVNYCPPSFDSSYIFNETNIRPNATNECYKICPMECEAIKYDTVIFTTKYPEIYLDWANQHSSHTKDLNRDDFLILRIFYGSFNYMSYRESPFMSFFGLVSNLGGILGLFLGNYVIYLAL